MVRDNELIGSLTVYRQEVRPFTDKQIALVTNFAAQAVIAIENARLLNELRQRTTDLTERTADLTEALEQQTATSEVLQVISRSPSDLEPVFQAILENATRICQAKFGVVFGFDGNEYHVEAQVGTPPELAEYISRTKPIQVLPGSLLDRVRQTKRVSYTADYAAEGIPAPPVTLGGARSTVDVPMLKDGELVGAFSIYRQEVRPFTERQIALLTNFAAQAVIAVENARLLNELRGALERQTATSEVLQVISSSPGDLTPVFAAMLEKAVCICGAKFGNIYRAEGDGLRNVVTYNTPTAFAEALRGSPYFSPAPNNPVRRMMTTKKIVHVLDVAATEAYAQREPIAVASVELGKTGTLMIVPMLKDNELVGAFTLARQEVRPFSDKQIDLVANFAAQAVIAIENARLLNELRQSLEQQTATAQVLQVISRSTGELAQVFSTILANATRICEAKFGTLYLKEGDGFRATATHNAPPAYEEARAQVVHPSPHTTLWQAANTKRPVHIVDVTLEQGYSEGDPFVLSAVKLGGYRSVLSVPLLQEDEVVGVISIFRQEVSSFSDEHVSLLQNFAAQAVIAIENARLLSDLQERTKELSALNEQLEQRVGDQVGEIERMGRLRRFLPPQVADLIVASGSEKQLESHRREITALFCDLRGFTGFTESADAEDVMALLRDYHAAIGEIIIKYNGTLERYAGDGVMVVFNDPVPVENPALQAVLMALEVRDAIGALTETWRRWGHDIGFGIGIAHGFATLGTIGFEGRFDYAAIGTVSNVASRLCDEAKPGQILISPRVLTKVENAVKVEPVGEFALKGIRRPLAAYNVVAALASKI
jgi:GAF domain-containing protein